MMKKILFLFVLLSTTMAQAQFHIGLRAGMNFSNMKFSDFSDNPFFSNFENQAGNIGYHAGIYTKLSLLIVEIQPELLFTRISGSFESTDLAGKTFTNDVGINRLDIPVLGITRLGPLRLGGGPVFSYQIGSVNSVLEDGLGSSTWGLQLLAGLEILKIQVDARYEFGLSDATNFVFVDGEKINVDSRPSQFIIALAYKLN